MRLTLFEVFNRQAQAIAQITEWYMLGWISHKERVRYEVYATERTEELYDDWVYQEKDALLQPLQNKL